MEAYDCLAGLVAYFASGMTGNGKPERILINAFVPSMMPLLNRNPEIIKA